MTSTAALAGLGPMLRPHSRSLVGASGLAIAGVAAEIALPWPVSLTVDHVLDGQPLPAAFDRLPGTPGLLVVVAAVTAVLLSAAVALLDYGVTVLSERAAEQVGAGLRHTVVDHALGLSLRWHDHTRSGEMTSRLTTDVGRVLDAIVALTTRLAPDSVLLVGVLLVLASIDPVLAGVGLVTLPVLAVLAARQRRNVRAAELDARTAAGHATATASDLFRNVRAVQAFARHRRALRQFDERNDTLLRRSLHAVRTEARWAPRADVVLAVGSSLVLVLGAQRVLAGQLSTGTLLVVLAYVRDLYRPVRSLARLGSTFAKAGASAARLRDVLGCAEAVSDHPSARPAPALPCTVRFEGVWFGYDPATPVLAGVHLTVGRGEKVCVMGPSGAGKSTLTHLLLRLYDVDAGAVTLDGVDVRAFGLSSLRQSVALVPQDPWLLDGTIAENIAYGAADATRAAVLAAGAAAHVDEFAHALPHGYDTVTGEGAALLSGGQRRRIALARAIVSRAPILVLDEPTASLDSASAREVIDAIGAAAAGRTVLMVTHDTELAAVADRVYVLDRRGSVAGVRPQASPDPASGPRSCVREEVNHVLRSGEASRDRDEVAARTTQPLP